MKYEARQSLPVWKAFKGRKATAKNARKHNDGAQKHKDKQSHLLALFVLFFFFFFCCASSSKENNDKHSEAASTGCGTNWLSNESTHPSIHPFIFRCLSMSWSSSAQPPPPAIPQGSWGVHRPEMICNLSSMFWVCFQLDLPTITPQGAVQEASWPNAQTAFTGRFQCKDAVVLLQVLLDERWGKKKLNSACIHNVILLVTNKSS